MTKPDEKFLWGEMRRVELEQAAERDCAVLVPVGSIEQHGPHLPVDCDISCAYMVSQEVARRLNDVIVAPPVFWGVLAPEWDSFMGTISVRSQTFIHLMGDICDSIARHGFRKIVVVNGHSANAPSLGVVANEFIMRHGFPIISVEFWNFVSREVLAKICRGESAGMGHAGELETSLQLLWRSSLVAMEAAPAECADARTREAVTTLTSRDSPDMASVSASAGRARTDPTGALGDPTLAVAETGQRIRDAVVDGLAVLVERFRKSEDA